MRAFALALVTALVWTSAVAARPWRLEDLFHLEDVGQAEFDPAGRYLLVERLRPRTEMTHFDMDDWGEIERRVPLVFDLSGDAGPRPLLSVDSGAGYGLGSISPDGRRVIVYRLQAHTYTLGVVEIATGRTQWLGVTPEPARLGQGIAWLSPTRLAAIIRPDNSLPLDGRMGFQAPQELARLSQVQADGREASVIALGSGRYLGLRPHPAPLEFVTFDLMSGSHRTLASGDLVDMAVSFDHRFVALLGNGGDIQYTDAELLHVGTPAFRRALTVVDLETGRTSQPTAGYDLLTDLLAWAPDSNHLLVYGRKGDDAWEDGRLLVVDAEHESATARADVVPDISRDRSEIPIVQADWANGGPLVYGHLSGSADDRQDWFRLKPSGTDRITSELPPSPRLLAIGPSGLLFQAGGGFWRVENNGRLAKLPAVTGAVPMAMTLPGEGDRFVYNNRPRRDWIWVRASDGGAQTVRRLGDVQTLPLEIDGAARVRATDDLRDRLVTVARDARGVLTLGLQGPTGAPRTLLRQNSNLDQIEPAVVHAVSHLSGSGSSVTSWLYLPPSLRPGVRPPLLVMGYPGLAYSTPPEVDAPGLSFVPGWLSNPQVIAGHGYAVLVVSMPLRTDLTDPADGFAPDILSAVDAAGATGLVDTSRLALWGHSYGGYAALEVATRSSRFSAIIASAADSDLATATVFPPFVRYHPADGLWIDATAGWLEEGQAQLHTQPWTDPERYVRRSPVFSAGAVKAPIMLISGEMDTASRFEQREEMFSALYRQAKTVILATYIGEGHMIYSPANLSDVYARVFSFLEQNIGPAAPQAGS